MPETCYAVIDCNNFFVSCERLFRPDLWQKPVIVLSNNDGCVVARSNESRALGIKMGQPAFEIRPLLKQHNVTAFSGNFSLYLNLSQRILSLIKAVSPATEPYSIDEAFINLSNIAAADRTALMQQLVVTIQQATHIPVSIGIAPTKTLAKLANELVKSVSRNETACNPAWPIQPQDGVLNLSETPDLLPYLTGTPIEDVWGIGRQTAPKLTSKGIITAADYIQTPIGKIQQQLNLPGEQIWFELQGRDRLGFQERSTVTKSLVVSRSFGRPVTDYKSTQQALSSFAETLARKLRQQKQQTNRLTVSLGWKVQSGTRYKPTTSATITLDQPTNLAAPLITAAFQALEQAWLQEFPVVKAGIGVSTLSSEAQTALSLFFDDSAQMKQDKLKLTWKKIDGLNQKYGHGLIMAGSSLKTADHSNWQSQRSFGSPRYVSNWNELARVK